MKIAFIAEPYIIDPLGIAYLIAALKKDRYEVSLLRTIDKDLIYKIRKMRPDILAYSVYTGRHQKFIDLNTRIRANLGRYGISPLSIFGGPHPTVFDNFLNEPYVDAICQGEFDESVSKTFTDILNHVVPSHTMITMRENPQNLDILPFPDRDSIYQFPENRKNPIKNIMTSRGCPFSCPYCYNSVFKKMFEGRQVRYRSIDSVIEESIKLVRDYPETRYIFFVDDEFLSSESRLYEFSEKWWLKVRLPFHVQLRADFVTDKKVKMLKFAGCTSVTFAIESGNEKIRKNLLQRKISDEQIYKAAKAFHKAGILFRTENMLALPGDTVDNALETLDLNIKCKPKIGWSSLFQPYPKTILGDAAAEQGLFDGNLDSIPSTFFEKTVLAMPKADKRRFENLQRLFGFICTFPYLRFLTRFLISLPRNRIYDYIYSRHKRQMYSSLFDWKG